MINPGNVIRSVFGAYSFESAVMTRDKKISESLDGTGTKVPHNEIGIVVSVAYVRNGRDAALYIVWPESIGWTWSKNSFEVVT